jgi:hypothetical protein
MAYLSPDLVQKALSISSSFAKGGTVATKPVARFALGGSAGDFEGVDFGGDDDPMGMADAVAEAVEKGNTGTTAAEVSAAIDALSDLDRGEGGGSLEERNRAIQSLLDQAERDSAPPPDTGGAAPPPRDDATTPAPTAAEAIRGPAVDPAIQEAIKAQAAVQAALATKTPASSVAPKEEESVTEKALQVDEFGPLFDTPATRPTVPAGGIAAAAAPPSTVQAPGGPDTAEDVGAIPGLTATIEEMAKQLEVEDLSKFSPPREATPTGGISSIVGALMDAKKGIGQALSGKAALSDLMKGGTPIRSEKDPSKFAGTVTYTTDPVTGKQVVEKVSPTSIGMSFDPALRDAYRDFYANQPEERDSDSDEPILPEEVAVEEEEAAPEKPRTIDIVPFRPEDFYYFYPRQQYGLPSMMNARTE